MTGLMSSFGRLFEVNEAVPEFLVCGGADGCGSPGSEGRCEHVPEMIGLGQDPDAWGPAMTMAPSQFTSARKPSTVAWSVMSVAPRR